jgi:tetratricopeptide (TPR) repeat protein
MTQQLKVMISSTARDLPDHRKQVMDACQRLGMFNTEMMEYLTATDADAMEVSLNMVNKADIYLGVFAFRYGYVPPDQTISVTEMEYNRAVERSIPRLIFLMSDDHAVKPTDVETGEGAEKLKKLKDRLKTERVVGFFKSADDLRGHVIQALVPYRESDLTTFHYVSDIPAAPEAYIAHPYTLLQTHRLVGRQMELRLLTDWVTKRQEQVYGARILNIIAIGGMGKSALTWKWFNEIAPQEMNPLTGRMWWSFYESDATFENFVTRALAYVTGRPLDEAQKLPPSEREAQLLAALDREPFLLALDGLERILISYARMDAAHLADSQVENKRNLRKTADPRAGRFLKKLAQVKNSRILVSSRLYPADLETDGGDPLPGTFRCDIEGLTDDDAVELWRAFGVSGSRDELLPVFITFGKHPLLIQALAGEIKRYHRAPGNFQEWRKANPSFDPAQFPRLQEAMAHVLKFALQNLSEKDRRVLYTIAAFRMPARYDTLTVLLIAEGMPCADERELDAVLTELEDRGLIGWDKRANRYDLHPIVRGVVWSGLADDTRHDVYIMLHIHFDSIPTIEEWEKVNSLEDLTPAIELYNTLIGLGRYDAAYVVFRDRWNKATLYRLSASRQRAELLEMLFPDGLDQLPRLRNPNDQVYILNTLALSYEFSGQPRLAAMLFRHSNTIIPEMEDKSLHVGLENLSSVLRQLGLLHESEAAARRALIITREQDDHFNEGISLYWIGITLAARGVVRDSESSLQRSLQIFTRKNEYAGFTLSYLAERALWSSEYAVADDVANRAWDLATQYGRYERSFILAARLQGAAALGLNDFAKADERLHHALTRARAVNHVEEELPALIALAELLRRQGDLKAARELLDDVWEPAERGPYQILHADAYNVLAQIERDEDNHKEAVEAATKAYRLAWCDGPPFAYHWGLEKARKHLQELSATEPEMPPFDESKYEPMPEVEIDPQDEFHVGNTSDD